jgi:phosphoglycerate dehydrogenase-like enzyme
MRIAILDDYQNAAFASADWSQVQARASVDVFTEPLGARAADILKPYEAIVAMRERQRFPRDLIAALPNLKFIAQTGMGAAHIDLKAASEHGIVVCGTKGDGAMSAEVELAWALILAAARQIAAADRAVREGRWQESIGLRLAGRVLGVIGLGNIGANVARIGQAFGMKIIAWSQNLTEERCREVGVEYADKATLLAQSDVISIHLKFSDRSRGLIGAADLARMKKTTILVNTSRGPIIDQDALLAALRAGAIGCAALDVYESEPLPIDHPMRSAPRTVLTPHIGFVADANYDVFYGQSVENILAFLDGKPLRLINPDVLAGVPR